MEARPAIRRSTANSHMGVSGALSSSTPVLQSPSQETYPKLQDSQQVSMERPVVHAGHLTSNSGVIGHIISSPSRFSTDLHYSSISPREKQSRKSPFISQSSSSASMPLSHSSPSEAFQSTASCAYSKENSHSWGTDSLPGFLDFPVNTPVQNSQIESSSCSGIMAAADEWQEWASQLVTDDDALTSNWSDLLVDDNVTNLEPKVKTLMWLFIICI